MADEPTLQSDTENLRGIASLLGVGNVACDKCGATIRHLERYCCRAMECPLCHTVFDTEEAHNTHFSQQHPLQTARGTRYCAACSQKNGYLKPVRHKKSGNTFLAVFASRDEEEVSPESQTSL